MGILKSFVAFIIGFIILNLFYYLVSIPFLPILSVMIASSIFNDNKGLRLRIFFVILLGLLGVLYYSINAYLGIIDNNSGFTFLGIIFEIITGIMFIFVTKFNVEILNQKIKDLKENFEF